MLALLLACGAPVEEELPPAAWIPPSVPEESIALAAPEGGVPLRLEFTGVNLMYRGFFADAEPARELALALAACVRGTPRVSITYGGMGKPSRIALIVRAGDLLCHARQGEDKRWEVDALVPVARALATWRNRIAAQRDMRVYTFRTGVHVHDAWGHATLWLDGQDPVDGSAFHPCLGLDGFDRCGPPTQDGVRSFTLTDVRLRNRLGDLLTDG